MGKRATWLVGELENVKVNGNRSLCVDDSYYYMYIKRR
jgi:hypothetical protein